MIVLVIKNLPLIQTISQKNFVELLQKLNTGDISDHVQLEEYLQKTAISGDVKNSAQLNILKLQLEAFLLSSEYYHKQLLMPDKNPQQSQQEVFNVLKIATNMILQGLNTATEENGVAFALRSLMENLSSSQRLKR